MFIMFAFYCVLIRELWRTVRTAALTKRLQAIIWPSRTTYYDQPSSLRPPSAFSNFFCWLLLLLLLWWLGRDQISAPVFSQVVRNSWRILIYCRFKCNAIFWPGQNITYMPRYLCRPGERKGGGGLEVGPHARARSRWVTGQSVCMQLTICKMIPWNMWRTPIGSTAYISDLDGDESVANIVHMLRVLFFFSSSFLSAIRSDQHLLLLSN